MSLTPIFRNNYQLFQPKGGTMAFETGRKRSASLPTVKSLRQRQFPTTSHAPAGQRKRSSTMGAMELQHYVKVHQQVLCNRSKLLRQESHSAPTSPRNPRTLQNNHQNPRCAPELGHGGHPAQSKSVHSHPSHHPTTRRVLHSVSLSQDNSKRKRSLSDGNYPRHHLESIQETDESRDEEDIHFTLGGDANSPKEDTSLHKTSQSDKTHQGQENKQNKQRLKGFFNRKLFLRVIRPFFRRNGQ